MRKAGLIFAALVSTTSLAQARDVSAQQVGVEYARENLEKAEAEHKDSLQRVADSEKRLADAQKRLADAQKRLADAQKRLAEDRQKAAAAKKNLDEANAKYVRAQELLDQAWKQP